MSESIKIVGGVEIVTLKTKVERVMKGWLQLEGGKHIRSRWMQNPFWIEKPDRVPEGHHFILTGGIIRFSIEAGLAREKGLI